MDLIHETHMILSVLSLLLRDGGCVFLCVFGDRVALVDSLMDMKSSV